MTYKIETTDPVTGHSIEQLVNMPYVIESSETDDLVIYFESKDNRDIYLKNPQKHQLEHYEKHSVSRH